MHENLIQQNGISKLKKWKIGKQVWSTYVQSPKLERRTGVIQRSVIITVCLVYNSLIVRYAEGEQWRLPSSWACDICWRNTFWTRRRTSVWGSAVSNKRTARQSVWHARPTLQLHTRFWFEPLCAFAPLRAAKTRIDCVARCRWAKFHACRWVD